MTEPKKEIKKEDPKKLGPIGKLKEFSEDKEEQMQILSTFVRLGILVWAGGILTLNYVTFPGMTKQDKIDPTFIASVFTGVLSSLGIQTASKKGDGTYKSDADKPMTKKDIAEVMATSNGGGNYQTIRVITPIEIKGADIVKYDPITGREIDPQNGKLV